jgi:uncharacterized protein
LTRIDKSLYADGIRFECTGCGECCRARHGYGYIYVTLKERQRLARHLGLPTRAFTQKYCEKTEDRFHLRDPANTCGFLEGERCTVYAARPQQCRSWPFWPENMNRKVWSLEVKRDCPGIGLGRVYSRQEIEAVLAEERTRENQS